MSSADVICSTANDFKTTGVVGPRSTTVVSGLENFVMLTLQRGQTVEESARVEDAIFSW